MLFYQVLPEYDNKSLPARLIYVKNELFTEKECVRWKVNKNFCKPVEVSKRSTYRMFGARFKSNIVNNKSMRIKTEKWHFTFIPVSYGIYSVTYKSPLTGKVWVKRISDMQLIDATNCEFPKRCDLIILKRMCKQN